MKLTDNTTSATIGLITIPKNTASYELSFVQGVTVVTIKYSYGVICRDVTWSDFRNSSGVNYASISALELALKSILFTAYA